MENMIMAEMISIKHGATTAPECDLNDFTGKFFIHDWDRPENPASIYMLVQYAPCMFQMICMDSGNRHSDEHQVSSANDMSILECFEQLHGQITFEG